MRHYCYKSQWSQSCFRLNYIIKKHFLKRQDLNYLTFKIFEVLVKL